MGFRGKRDKKWHVYHAGIRRPIGRQGLQARSAASAAEPLSRGKGFGDGVTWGKGPALAHKAENQPLRLVFKAL